MEERSLEMTEVCIGYKATGSSVTCDAGIVSGERVIVFYVPVNTV